MKTTATKTALLALATAALLSATASVASAQEFTIPTAALERSATVPADQATPVFSAIAQGRSAAAPVAGHGHAARALRHDSAATVGAR